MRTHALAGAHERWRAPTGTRAQGPAAAQAPHRTERPAKKRKKARPPFDRSKLMGPDNPMWVKMYAEEMAKRNTAQTTAVVKKWLKEE